MIPAAPSVTFKERTHRLDQAHALAKIQCQSLYINGW